MSGISYKLEKFEGPLDLLLHLIDKDKINIYDIPIVSITAQYLDYVKNMEEEDLDTMSEFVVMAATLLDIKAKMLLPAEIDEESGEEIDPRAELVERLLEYKKFKQLGEHLQDGEFWAERVLFKDESIPAEVKKYIPPVNLDEMFGDLSLEKLNAVFLQVMKQKDNRVDKVRSEFGEIKKEPISLEKKINSLMGFARKKRSFSFRSLLSEAGSKLEVVVTFLAVLELMKIGKLGFVQEEAFSDIIIETLEKEGEESELDLSDLGE